MKKSCLTATMVNIPDDVLRNNIFIRLPAKQVARMRSLSKTWNHVLSDPSFIKSHLHHSIHKTTTIKLMIFSNTEPNPTDNVECFLNLWNPSLSALIVLPNSNIPFVLDGRCNQSVFRFGYDPKTDDYKVVMLTYVHKNQEGIEWHPIKVYSVQKGYWESISEKFSAHITGFYCVNEVSGDGHDGHVHMLCYLDASSISQTIIAFDLGDETFSEISLPDPIQRYNNSQTNVLGVLFEKLCVMSCMSQGDCEVWVMEEYGVTTSWVKRLVFTQLFTGHNIPLGFTLRGELIFEFGDRHLALYDSNGDILKVLKTIEKEVIYLKIVQYVDSLVWVAHLVGNSCGSTQTV
ncbi:F-box protein CPR1-like [Rutidosis leptorrhynchoides]|uniref:F-box protein CPR1-like n=1 Tax=Rutidosis leptorrhynchoides TaxID=125765 RepID=UPI003A99A28B